MGKLGADTSVGEGWVVIRRMSGSYRRLGMLVLEDGEEIVAIHSVDHFGEEGIMTQTVMMSYRGGELEPNYDNIDPSNMLFFFNK